MEERTQSIRQYLQDPVVQKRILEKMQRARDEATVTISNAARIYGFTENQLRDWDEKGLLKPQRRGQEDEQNGKSTRRRQYTPAELSKLAIIHELMEEGKFSIGAIPSYVEDIWAEVASRDGAESYKAPVTEPVAEHIPIDRRIRTTNDELFWRYFASQALRLSLMLICEDIPNTKAGLILPLNSRQTGGSAITFVDDLSTLDECLIGWMSLNRSSYAFLDQHPTFEHSSDFRVQCLQVMNKNIPDPKDVSPQNIYILLQREAKPLTLNTTVVRTIRSLLAIVYEHMPKIRSALGPGMRDWPYQATDFTASVDPTDDIMNDIADLVVAIGKGKWSFSCILLPRDASLPMPQHSLVVRTQSKDAPHTPAISSVSALTPGLSFRAYQSGKVLYRSSIISKDFMMAHQEQEENTRSAIAIPLSGNDGLSTGVLYIASSETNAFTKDDERLLRLIGRMIEELLLTYRSRRLATGRLTNVITMPEVVDLSFKDFASESDFIQNIEVLLLDIRDHGVAAEFIEKSLSIIAVDIDNLAGIAIKHGDLVARNLSNEVGERILGWIQGRTKPEDKWLYHVSADRFFALFKDSSLEEARNKAKSLKSNLIEDYRLDARRIFTKRDVLPETLLLLSNVTVRLGVHAYKYQKLEELLRRFSRDINIPSVTEIIATNIERALMMGKTKNGNIIISWDDIRHDNVVLDS